MLKKIGIGMAAAAMFVAAYFLSNQLGNGIVRLLERNQPTLLYQYASDDQFTENVYLSDVTNNRYGVPGRLPNLTKPGDLTATARQITKNKWEIAEALEKNPSYLDYLQRQGTSLSGFFSFSQRLAEMQDNIVYACRYLLFLLWVTVLHLMMRCRPALYFAMGLLCILTTSIKLSGKLAAIAFFGSGSPYLISNGLLPPLLEAMLTFLIFDITIAAREKVRLSHKVESLYKDLPALQYLVIHLAQSPDQAETYRSDISRLLPHFSDYIRTGKRKRKKALRLMRAIESLSGPHTNRSFLEAAVELQTLLPRQ